MFILPVAVGALVWSGVRFVLDALQRRRKRPDLDKYLGGDGLPNIADEAQDWLRSQ